MIRINLLAPERTTRKAKDRGPAPTPGALQSYLLLALFAGGAAVLVWLIDVLLRRRYQQTSCQ